MLTIPTPIDVGYSLIGGKNEISIRIQNQGGPGKFCFVKQDDWPAANFRNAVTPHSTTIGPFTIWPSMFEIQTGEERDLVIQFAPKVVGNQNNVLYLACDNCQTKGNFLGGCIFCIDFYYFKIALTIFLRFFMQF